MIVKTCRECGSIFNVPARLLERFVNVCGSCSERAALRDQAKAIAVSAAIRDAQWRKICPLDYLATDINRLPDQRAFRQVMDWQYGPNGIFLCGGTGAGKSRRAWILGRARVQSPQVDASMNSSSGIKYAAMYSGVSTTDAAMAGTRLNRGFPSP